MNKNSGLYRAKRKDNGEWLMGYMWRGASCVYIIPHNLGISYDDKTKRISAVAHEVDPDTICLYSGITDNCGNIIFDGSLIRMHGNPMDLAVIEYGEFVCVSIDPPEKIDRVIGWHYRPLPADAISQVEPICWEFQLNAMWIKENDIRVIGHIHDHSDLLKGADHA